MPAVLVHGVPETPAVWDRLVPALGRADVVTPRLPGFGCPLPGGFEPGMERYLDWLVAEVEAVGEPVDLVGHDWGALLVDRFVTRRPDLVRTWVSDQPILEDLRWHAVAEMWQTPGQGEEIMEAMAAAVPEDTAAGLAGMGMPEDAALEMARTMDDVMRRAILGLYRSAIHMHRDWAPPGPVPRPGLVLEATDDPFHSRSSMRRFAERTGAELAVIEDVGHWWMLQAPERAAPLLTALWESA